MHSGIAVIGMAGRFPQAPDVDVLWQSLCAKVEAIRAYTIEELVASGVDPLLLENPRYIRSGSCFDQVELFDAPFFGMPPREAEITDPQHRIFLECAWEALEDAGYCGDSYGGQVGLYAGAAMNTYLTSNLACAPRILESVDLLQLNVGNSHDFLATRASYKLNLRGPSYTVQTACSTSLVAIHVACQSLLRGECDMALAGGICINHKLRYGYEYLEGSMTSPDGHCRAFDADAKGTVFGSGVGIVVLKPLKAALADRDNVRAIILGTAINNDGSNKIGYTAPSISGQAQVISEALANANVSAETIDFVEAHGTGTPLGDPIEVQALTKAYRAHTRQKGYCAIGSIKTNLGHLDAAAGAAGFIKAVLALQHKKIPPTLHFVSPNPEMGLEESPFYVNSELVDWKARSHPRRAGVSSFGVGGTNAHVILEEAPQIDRRTDDGRTKHLFMVSARTAPALEQATDNLATHLRNHPELHCGNVAFTLQTGRKSFVHRRFAVCRSVDEAAEILQLRTGGKVFTGEQERHDRPVVFLFPGQGSQYPEMGRELYRDEEVYRREFDRCAQILQGELNVDLRDRLYGANSADELLETWLVQPALFVVEYAMARTWMEWGVEPDALIGHSLGEYVAATLAGVFSLEVALRLVASRGRLMQPLDAGAMIAVGLEESEIGALAGNELSLAAINGPQQCVLSGPIGAVKKLEQFLTMEGVSHRRLKTSHAFHSKMVDPMLDVFREELQSVELKAPQRRYLSNITGSWITKELATDPEYWVRQIRHTVRFSQGIQELLHDPRRIFLEVGPGQTLCRIVKQHVRGANAEVLSSTPSGEIQDCGMEVTLGGLWLAGASIDWSRFHGHAQYHRVALPRYPFERQRYWIDPEFRIADSAQRTHSQIESAKQSAADSKIDVVSRPDESLEALATLHDRPPLRNSYIAATTAPERIIAKLCQDALGIKEVGVDDNFFELGGDSLTALRVIADVKEHFGLEIPAVSIYESLTVRGLAELIANRGDTKQEAELPSETQQRASRMQRRRNRLRREPHTQTTNDLI